MTSGTKSSWKVVPHKLRSFWTKKGTTNWVKRKPFERETIFFSYTPHRGLASRVSKEIKKKNSRKEMSQIKVSYESEELWKEIRVAKKCLKTVKKIMALVGSSVFVAECCEQILSSVVMEMLSSALSVGFHAWGSSIKVWITAISLISRMAYTGSVWVWLNDVALENIYIIMHLITLQCIENIYITIHYNESN